MPSKGPLDFNGVECPATCPVMCGPDTMWCAGGMSPNGCPMPNTCVPMQGPPDNDGNPCPSICPTPCGPGDMTCPGFMDPNGCPTADVCMPLGSACPVPPTQCPE